MFLFFIKGTSVAMMIDIEILFTNFISFLIILYVTRKDVREGFEYVVTVDGNITFHRVIRSMARKPKG